NHSSSLYRELLGITTSGRSDACGKTARLLSGIRRRAVQLQRPEQGCIKSYAFGLQGLYAVTNRIWKEDSYEMAEVACRAGGGQLGAGGVRRLEHGKRRQGDDQDRRRLS